LRPLRRRNEVEEQSRLAPRQQTAGVGAHDEELLVQRVPPTILHRRGIDVEAVGRLGVQVPKHGAPAKIVADTIRDVAAHDLEQWVSRRYPFERRVVAKQALVEDHALVLASELAETRLEPLADRAQRLRHLADAVDVLLASNEGGMDAGDRPGRGEEVLHDFGNETPLLGLH